MQALILGPSNAGKSTMLATLSTACNRSGNTLENAELSIGEKSANMLDLEIQALKNVKEGRSLVTSTWECNHYTFKAVLTRKTNFLTRWLNNRIQECSFDVLDIPGGVPFPKDQTDEVNNQTNKNAEYKRVILDRLKIADGMVLCLDCKTVPNDSNTAINLRKTLSLMDSLKLQRLFICLTKADVLGSGADAYNAASQADGWCHLPKLLDCDTLSELRNKLNPDTEIAIGFTSPYGFLTDGSANVDEHGSLKTRIYPESINSWAPYRVIDPILFLMGKPPLDITVKRAKDWSPCG